MSAETLKAVHDAIAAHVRDRNENQDIMIDDWFVSFGGMMHNPDSPTGVGHLSGYMVSENSTPQSSLGIATLGIDELRDSLITSCCCHGGDD